MAVGLNSPDQLFPVPGIRLAATHCGIKVDAAVKDLVLVEIASGSSVATVFTSNRFCAAPVTLARQNLRQNSSPKFLLVNSGNANAGTGLEGMQAATSSCAAVAKVAQVEADAVLPFSTGVIATALPVDLICGAIPSLVSKLKSDNWLAAAEGIMTTDTLPKAFSRQVIIRGKTLSITGIDQIATQSFIFYQLLVNIV